MVGFCRIYWPLWEVSMGRRAVGGEGEGVKLRAREVEEGIEMRSLSFSSPSCQGGLV